MAGGYMGKMLFVNLSSGLIEEEELEETQCRAFIGGSGLGAKVLYQRQKAGVDPLGPENLLGFVTGPLTGTAAPSAARYMVVTKSPLTGTWGDANSGGYIGNELKRAGYDAIFFSGISLKPVYLLVHDGKAELKDAAHLWGKDTVETEETLQRELGDPAIRVACIGPAGEMQSLISGVVNDKGRVAARSGVGAVMGAKRLKAIALRGTRKIPIANKTWLNELRREAIKEQREVPFIKTLIEHGTCGLTASLTIGGASPIRNWSLSGGGSFPTVEKLTGEAVTKYQLRKFACSGCPIACGGIVRVKEGPFAVEETHKPEYETLAAFGTMCLNDDVEAVTKLNDLCNRYGLDTISTGTAIAFAMECYERGILTREDTDGIVLTWGDPSPMMQMVERMAKRQGFGAVLADGVRRAAERIGQGSEAFAIHVRGQEPGFHSPLYAPGRGMGFLGDPAPGRHTASAGAARMDLGGALGKYPELQPPKIERYDYQHKGQMYATATSYYQVVQASGMCLFPMLSGVMPLVEYTAAVTGWDCTISELLTTGQRIQTLRHAFNVREGLRPQDFHLPDRLVGRPPASAGPLAGITIDEEVLKREYYKVMDWNLETGRPSDEMLAQLGLKELLEGLG